MEKVRAVRLRYASRARADIDQILEYISQHSRSGATAVARQIHATAELLLEHPGLGRRTAASDVKVIRVTRYPFLIYHRVKGDELIVLHIRHASRMSPTAAELDQWRK